MASPSKIRPGMTLEDFLRWRRINRRPYLEYFGDRIEAKVSPQLKHALLTGDFLLALNRFARPTRLGRALPELRCTFAGRSIIPDVVFLLDAHIRSDERGRPVDETNIPPDIHIEIRSPDQSLKKTREKLAHSVANGCPLGWFVDPERETIDLYRPGHPPFRLPPDGVLDGAPVLPGFLLPVAEVFGWLVYREPTPDGPGADPS